MWPCIWLPSSRCVLHDPRFLVREALVIRMDATGGLQDSAGYSLFSTEVLFAFAPTYGVTACLSSIQSG